MIRKKLIMNVFLLISLCGSGQALMSATQVQNDNSVSNSTDGVHTRSSMIEIDLAALEQPTFMRQASSGRLKFLNHVLANKLTDIVTNISKNTAKFVSKYGKEKLSIDDIENTKNQIIHGLKDQYCEYTFDAAIDWLDQLSHVCEPSLYQKFKLFDEKVHSGIYHSASIKKEIHMIKSLKNYIDNYEKSQSIYTARAYDPTGEVKRVKEILLDKKNRDEYKAFSPYIKHALTHEIYRNFLVEKLSQYVPYGLASELVPLDFQNQSDLFFGTLTNVRLLSHDHKLKTIIKKFALECVGDSINAQEVLEDGVEARLYDLISADDFAMLKPKGYKMNFILDDMRECQEEAEEWSNLAGLYAKQKHEALVLCGAIGGIVLVDLALILCLNKDNPLIKSSMELVKNTVHQKAEYLWQGLAQGLSTAASVASQGASHAFQVARNFWPSN